MRNAVCTLASPTGQDHGYGTVVGLGGMCFLELDFFKKTGHSGPWGLFCDVFTTPKVVAACLDDDFKELLNPVVMSASVENRSCGICRTLVLIA